MESSRPCNDDSKQYAFVWKPTFFRRHDNVYLSDQESSRYVAPPRQSPLTGGIITHENIAHDVIVEKFVNNQCEHEFDRYSYRTQLLEEFLNQADLEALNSRPVTKQPSSVLVDDRNNNSASRENPGGLARAPLKPLTAQQLYGTLLAKVFKFILFSPSQLGVTDTRHSV